MPNLSTKVNSLYALPSARMDVHFYDRVFSEFKSEISNYKGKGYSRHLQAIEKAGRGSELACYVLSYFDFKKIYFSTLKNMESKELNLKNLGDSALGYTEEPIINFFTSCARNVWSQFDSSVRFSNYSCLKAELENEFKSRIQKPLRSEIIKALKEEAKDFLKKSIHSTEVLNFRAYCNALLASDFKKLTAMPVPESDIMKHASMKRFLDLLIHAHELGMPVKPEILQRFGFKIENELPLKAKFLLDRYASELSDEDFLEFSKNIHHMIFGAEITPNNVYPVLLQMIDSSWGIKDKFLKQNFSYLADALRARQDLHRAPNIEILDVVAGLGSNYDNFEDVVDFKNYICDLLRLHESDAVANQVMSMSGRG